MTKVFSRIVLVCIVGLVFSCNDDDNPTIPNQEELITTLRYTLTPTGGGTPIVLNFQDLDGDGGNPPIVSGGSVAANQTYNGVLTLSNESQDPAEDITAEILEEDEDHQFFFSTTVSGISVQYSDMDADGNPVGLQTTVSTGTTGSGTLTVVLRHLPNKDAAGVSDGDITNAGGETDIEVTFPISVQ